MVSSPEGRLGGAFDSLDPDLQALVGDLAKRIYGGEEITFDSDLLHHTAKPLVDGLQKGYGKSLVEVEYNSPDYKALENLTKNAFKFSASKDFHILQDMTNALRDGDRVRSFDEFRAEVDKINVKYNQNWLRTEYNQAIAASQATARWQEFQDNAKAMPFLQYQAVMDSNTRPDHQRLHGVIKRIDNPFWNTHFPPLGWGCRCEVIQLPGKNHKETPDGSFQKPDVPPQFRENFGKKQQLFSDKHPYYQNKCQGCTKTAKLAAEDNLQCQACLKAGKECQSYIKECRKEKVIEEREERKRKEREEKQRKKIETAKKDTKAIIKEIEQWDSMIVDKRIVEEAWEKYNSYDDNWERLFFDHKSGGYVVFNKKHQYAHNEGGGRAEIAVSLRLARFNGKRVEMLDENGEVGLPDLGFDSHTWDVKKIDKANQDSIVSAIENASKADKVIFYWTIENNQLEKIGEAKKRSRTGASVYYLENNVLTPIK